MEVKRYDSFGKRLTCIQCIFYTMEQKKKSMIILEETNSRECIAVSTPYFDPMGLFYIRSSYAIQCNNI